MKKTLGFETDDIESNTGTESPVFVQIDTAL